MRYLLIGALCTLFIVSSCSNLGLISREEIVKGMGPLLSLETRSSNISTQLSVLSVAGLIDEENLRKVKAHYDVYFIYYLAANVSLAQGDMQDYFLNVESARIELDSIDEILGAVVVLPFEEKPSGDPT